MNCVRVIVVMYQEVYWYAVFVDASHARFLVIIPHNKRNMEITMPTVNWWFVVSFQFFVVVDPKLPISE